jgi:hypothetical protein
MNAKEAIKCLRCFMIIGCDHNRCSKCTGCDFVCVSSVSGGFCEACTMLKLMPLYVKRVICFGC